MTTPSSTTRTASIARQKQPFLRAETAKTPVWHFQPRMNDSDVESPRVDDSDVESWRTDQVAIGEAEDDLVISRSRRPRRAIIIDFSSDEEEDVLHNQACKQSFSPGATTDPETADRENQKTKDCAGAPQGALPVDMPLLVAPPPYWEPFNPRGGVGVKKYVLPLEGDSMAGTVRAVAPSLRRADIRKLEQGGMSPSVAKELLRFCNGDVEDACNLAPQANKYIDVLLHSASDPAVALVPEASGNTDVAAAFTAARKAEELERVCARFEDGGLPRERLVRVERVQNWRLWACYVDRRNEDLAPEERYLWCGLSTQDLDKVIIKGFSALASSGNRTAAFVANAAVAVDQAVEGRRKTHGQEVHQALDPTPPEAAVTAAEGGQAETVAAPVVGQAPHAAGLGDRPLRMWSMFPRLFGSVRAQQQNLSEGTRDEPVTSSAVASAANVQVPAAPLPDCSASGSSQPAAMDAPGRRTSPDFPGKGGALLLCRVVLGKMAIGGSDENADSVLDTAAVAASIERRAAAGPARVPRAVPAAAVDPAWDLRPRVYADDLAVSLRRAAVQAYPEYVVHYD